MLFGRINCGLEKAEGTHVRREDDMNFFVGVTEKVSPEDGSIGNYWRPFSPGHR